MKKVIFWFDCLRAYALPMSFMAWIIPFSLGLKQGGNWLYGLVALVGIICVHLGANLFDDVVDYKKYLKNCEKNNNLNFKKGKCKFFVENLLSIKKALFVVAVLFAIASAIGVYFVLLYKLPILLLIVITAILCLFYPLSGYLGLSEIIIGLIYAPLLFTGVYYVMVGRFSSPLEWMSLSFALVTVTLLYTDFFLDYSVDKKAGKRTLPVLSGNKSNAYYLYMFIIFLIFANLFFCIHSHVFSLKYGLIFLAIVPAMRTMKNLQYYVTREISDEKEFMNVMNDTQKFIAVFSIFCVIAFIIG